MTHPDRYARQAILPEIGPKGQRALGRARVAVVGVGALGCVSADLLARAGVGHLRLVDRDVVEVVNLQRQTLYSESDVDRPKAEAAAERLRAVNSSSRIAAVPKDLHAASVAAVVDGIDLIVDGTDNLETRFLLNETALDARLAFVYGGAVGTYGMVFAIRSPETACFRCVTPRMPPPGTLPTCDTAGVLNAVSAQVGSLQAGEAIRLLVGEPPAGDLLVLDGWRPEIQRIRVVRRPDCPACARGEREFLGAKRSQMLASLCGGETISVDPVRTGRVDFDAMERRLARLGTVRRAGSVLVVDAEGHRLTVFEDGRTLIRGVSDEVKARSVYAKYVGS
ncbi:MAG: ThiF family adenylyltransferase [Methanobacteriota archaeon]